MGFKASHNSSFIKYSTTLLFLVTCCSFVVFPAYAERDNESKPDIATNDGDEVNEIDHEKAVLNAVVEQLAKNEDEITNNSEVDDSDTVNSSDHKNDWMDDFDQEVVGSDAEDEPETKNEKNEESVDELLVAEKNKKVIKKKKKRSRNKMTEGEKLTANFILNTPLPNKKTNTDINTQSGWVYLGRFASKGWFNKTLDIKKSLPRVGTSYTVMQSLNMRTEPPAKQGTAQLIKNLKIDDSVKILEVRRSGRNGHYWAQVELQ